VSAFRPAAGPSKVAKLSSESIASPIPAGNGAVSQCERCGAPLADDQRYCLECGERGPQMSDLLRTGMPAPAASEPPAPTRVAPAGADSPLAAARRSSTLNLIAGIGVLLLAMGVGVLIGRSGGARPSSAPAQVITLGSAAGSGTETTSAETFSDDWPAGTSGYTVQLQTLPVSGTRVSAIAAAKAAASAKGAKGVGALKSADFSSLPAGGYVIYAGIDHTRAQASKALTGLKKLFPAATVVRVANGAGGSGPSGAPPSGGGHSSLSHPAPPSALEGLSHAKGKSYEERSKNLPDVVSTG
jgi:hypothetical protein